MAEVKHKFSGIAKFNAFLIYSAMGTGPLAFLTQGILGTITFKVLEVFGNWFANQGLALLNIGYDEIKIAVEQNNYESVIDDAIKKVKANKGKLTHKQKKEIDDDVIKAFRDFVRFV